MAALAGLVACSDDDGAAPVPVPAATTTGTGTTTTATTSATTTTTAPSAATVTDSPTGIATTFDCASVEAAQQRLDDAYSGELERLDVGRGDPRAQSVYALVTTTEGSSYYASVLSAAPAELQPDARLVLGYYQRLATSAAQIDPGSGSAEDLHSAMTALDDASAAFDDPATTGSAVVDAQERLQAGVQRACTGSASTTTTAGSQSSSGTATTTG